MTFKYIGSTGYAGKATPRNSKTRGVIIHHAATTSLATVARMFAGTFYEVSANAIGTSSGIIQAVPENMRAWTSGSRYDNGAGADFDHERQTIEIINSTKAPTWKIADATYGHVAAWISYLSKKYGFPINRDTVIGHNELWKRYRASYQTECPGGIDLDRLVREARSIRAGKPAPTPGEEEMTPAQMKELKQYIDARTRSAAGSQSQIVKSSDGHWLDVGTGRVGIWGVDLQAIRNGIVALNWQRRDGAGPKGKSDLAYASGGPGPSDYYIFEQYRRAAVEGRKITSPITKPKGGPKSGSAALTAALDAAPGLTNEPPEIVEADDLDIP